MNHRRNILHLFVWQGSTFLVPLIVTPYLARALGIYAFGVYGVTIAVVAFASLIADWGFNLSATQKVARAVDDEVQLRRLFWGTLLAKLMLTVVALVGLALAAALLPTIREHWLAIAAGVISVAATGLSVNWFLQGQQRMAAFAAASLTGRLLTIPLIILLVHSPDDVAMAVAIHGVGQLVAALASLFVSLRISPLLPIRIEPRFALRQVADGWHQFISTVAVALYTQANALFVGIRAGQVEAGLITGSQRLQGAFLGLIQPVVLALYPYVNRLTVTDPPHAVRVMVKVLVALSGYGCALGLAMYLSAPYVVPLFLGEAFAPAVEVVQVLALLPPLAGITNALGSNMLLPLGLKRAYSHALLGAGVTNVSLLLLLTGSFGALGAAYAAVGTEVFLMLAMGFSLYRNLHLFRSMQAGDRLTDEGTGGSLEAGRPRYES
jgi:O-antigen/teichoic acid export membrane protein